MMIPLAADIISSESISVSATAIASASIAFTNEAVDINNKQVRFTITKPRLSRRKEYLKKEIKFQWVLYPSVPDNVRIVIKVGTKQYVLEGLNHDSSLIELLKRNNNSHFHFPNSSSVFEIPIQEIYKTCTELYDSQAGAAWAVTWPREESFWYSEHGFRFLCSQYKKMITSNGMFQPRRIGVCPFSLDSNNIVTRRYFIALEVQYLIGFDIRMISAETIAACFGKEDLSVTLYGSAVRILSKNIGDTDENNAVYATLVKNDVNEGLKLYKEAYSASEYWCNYKSTNDVKFNPSELVYIENRQNNIKVFGCS
ncbi:MAG: hypothetical protein HWD84_11050 [Flavobacteriaceae bacterium]|nr:hypothetical protein [Flavobacteriaceae bacterium]